MIVYCLFCETQKAAIVARILENRGMHRAFTPQILQRHRVKGQNLEKLYPLLPGYVFVYVEKELNPTLAFLGISGIIRRLGRKEDRFCLQGSDLDFAMKLYEKDGLVNQLTVFKAGDTVRLEDPLFNGCQGKISKVDYKKQRACVEFIFAGTNCRTWIACEFISPHPADGKTAKEEAPRK